MIRGRILRSMMQIKSYISCLQTTEMEALTRLTGQQGVETCARIADFILTELGHDAPTTNGKTQSHRAVAKAFADIPSVAAIDTQIKRIKKRRKVRVSKATLQEPLPSPEPVHGTAEAR